ncbi:MAG: hypothetical protein ACYCR2_05925 [Thermoplasmataceae archaeon]
MGKPAQCVLFLFPGYNALTMIMLKDGRKKRKTMEKVIKKERKKRELIKR